MVIYLVLGNPLRELHSSDHDSYRACRRCHRALLTLLLFGEISKL